MVPARPVGTRGSMMLLWGLMQATVLSGAMAAESVAECIDSPLIVEEETVTLFHVEGGKVEDSGMIEAISSFVGDSAIRVTNNTDQPLAINITLSGDEGFSFAELDQESPTAQTSYGKSHGFTLPAWSSDVIPLGFSPPVMSESSDGGGFAASTGYATVTLGETQSADYYNEVYLKGFAISIPDYSDPEGEVVPGGGQSGEEGGGESSAH